MENFTHLHVHTVYSVYDAISTPDEIAEQAKLHGHTACAITDHGNMSGTFAFQRACLKRGIKPLLGMEGYVVDKLVEEDEKGKRKRNKNNHIILLAKDEVGWKSLLKLNYLSNSDENHFYYKPRFSFKELFENKEGLVVSSACLASSFSNLLKLGKEKEAEDLFARFCTEFGEDFYAELQMNEIPDQKDYNQWLISQATHYGIPLILTADVHYALPEGAETQEMAFKMRDGKGEEQTFECRHLYYSGIEDFKKFNKLWNYKYTDEQIEEWCGNTMEVANKVNYLIPERTKMRLPRQAFDEDREIINLAQKGLCDFFHVNSFNECPKDYRDRLLFELNLIVRKGISRYFLVLRDIIKWCDENKISHGVARGSVGGSLVARSIGIIGNAINPMELLFERFISNERLVDCYIDYSKSGNSN